MDKDTGQLAGLRIAYPAFLLFAVFLAATFTDQVKWFSNLVLFKQPGLWALISVSGMVVTALVACIQVFIKPKTAGVTWRSDVQELGFWVRACEYLVWFMVYVFAVPYLGYLPCTILFTTLLTLRVGHRSMRWCVRAILLAVVTVVIFRAFLQVKIPGGQIYEWLPSPLSKFLLMYL